MKGFKHRVIRGVKSNESKRRAMLDITKDYRVNYIPLEYLVFRLKNIPQEIIPIDTVCPT